MFNSLRREQLSRIVELQLEGLRKRLAQRGIHITLSDAARQVVGENEVFADSMTSSGANWKAFALDGAGQIAAPIALKNAKISAVLPGKPKYKTVWYLLRRSQ